MPALHFETQFIFSPASLQKPTSLSMTPAAPCQLHLHLHRTAQTMQCNAMRCRAECNGIQGPCVVTDGHPPYTHQSDTQTHTASLISSHVRLYLGRPTSCSQRGRQAGRRSVKHEAQGASAHCRASRQRASSSFWHLGLVVFGRIGLPSDGEGIETRCAHEESFA